MVSSSILLLQTYIFILAYSETYSFPKNRPIIGWNIQTLQKMKNGENFKSVQGFKYSKNLKIANFDFSRDKGKTASEVVFIKRLGTRQQRSLEVLQNQGLAPNSLNVKALPNTVHVKPIYKVHKLAIALGATFLFIVMLAVVGMLVKYQCDRKFTTEKLQSAICAEDKKNMTNNGKKSEDKDADSFMDNKLAMKETFVFNAIPTNQDICSTLKTDSSLVH